MVLSKPILAQVMQKAQPQEGVFVPLRTIPAADNVIQITFGFSEKRGFLG